MFELIILGIIVGSMSGFFGIGGGTILVPMLLILGFDTKVAIGISVVQMVFGSLYGSYLNNKKGTLDLVMITTIGLGGFIGALFSGSITFMFSSETLEILFLAFTIFALIRLFVKREEGLEEKTLNNKPLLLVIGFFIGTISMTIGVGGSLLLVPILVGFLHVPIAKATSAGLFFVVFSSIAGLISHSLHDHIDYQTGVSIGLASLLGVYIGIHFKHIVSPNIQKRLLMLFYIMIVTYLIYRIFGV
ncbi:TSUP family transporter [Sulfurimonas aquatica]|uniref:Probable membrane transporter protein n=1 Tax=Sulfurimonas aquatica TaxID=2672570 RepID=A0A975GD20_9BACT|nr:sulfite exporter TauE/SafE family protein [Sulfurimonas aquatica]QSZ41859.1 TSUP family transporter [Sulfurimonas aquatica]